MVVKRRLFVLVIVFTLFFMHNTAHSFLGVFGDGDIDTVKNGTLSIDTSTSIGNALDGNDYFINGEWSTFEDKQKRKFVRYTADVKLMAFGKSEYFDDILIAATVHNKFTKQIKFVIEFSIKQNGSFSFYNTYLTVDGVHYDNHVNDKNILKITEQDIVKSLEAVYSNNIPFEYNIVFMLKRNIAIGSLRKMTNNLNQTFYQLSASSEYAIKRSSDYNLYNNSLRWANRGVDASKTFFKIKSIDYDSIAIESVFFVTRGYDDGDVRVYTLNESVPHVYTIGYTDDDEYRLNLKIDDDLEFHIFRNKDMFEYLQTRVSYSETIDGKRYNSNENLFICDESARSNENLNISTFNGVFIDESDNEYVFIEESGAVHKLSISDYTGGKLDKAHNGGSAFKVTASNGNLIRLAGIEIKAENSKVEGYIVDIDNKELSVILESKDSSKYKIFLGNHIMGLRRYGELKFITGKGYLPVGFNGKVMDGVWTIDAFSRWYYDDNSKKIIKGNIANYVDGPHSPSKNNSNNKNSLITIEESLKLTEDILSTQHKVDIENGKQKSSEKVTIDVGPYNYNEKGFVGTLLLSNNNGLLEIAISTANVSSWNSCEFSGVCSNENLQLECSSPEYSQHAIYIKKSNDSIIVDGDSDLFCGAGAMLHGTYKLCDSRVLQEYSVEGVVSEVLDIEGAGYYLTLVQHDGKKISLSIEDDISLFKKYINKNVAIEALEDQYYEDSEDFCKITNKIVNIKIK